MCRIGISPDLAIVCGVLMICSLDCNGSLNLKSEFKIMDYANMLFNCRYIIMGITMVGGRIMNGYYLGYCIHVSYQCKLRIQTETSHHVIPCSWKCDVPYLCIFNGVWFLHLLKYGYIIIPMQLGYQYRVGTGQNKFGNVHGAGYLTNSFIESVSG